MICTFVNPVIAMVLGVEMQGKRWRRSSGWRRAWCWWVWCWCCAAASA